MLGRVVLLDGCENTNWVLKKVSWRNFSEIEVCLVKKQAILWFQKACKDRQKTEKSGLWLKKKIKVIRNVPPNSAPSLLLRMAPRAGFLHLLHIATWCLLPLSIGQPYFLNWRLSGSNVFLGQLDLNCWQQIWTKRCLELTVSGTPLLIWPISEGHCLKSTTLRSLIQTSLNACWCSEWKLSTGDSLRLNDFPFMACSYWSLLSLLLPVDHSRLAR